MSQSALRSRIISAWDGTFTALDFVSMRNRLTTLGRANDNVTMPAYSDLSNTYNWAVTYSVACVCDCVCACSK